MTMKSEEWEGLVRNLDWTFSYVDEAQVFPDFHSGSGSVPRDAWAKWEEDYKTTYSEYVSTQRDKEFGAYSVKAALQRSQIFDQLDDGWKACAKVHYGATVLVEYLSVIGELRMARFGLAPGWRNMAVFGALDELRHTQIGMFFGHEFVAKDAQYDWTQKAYQTNHWGIISARAFFESMMITNAVDIAIQLPLAFETSYTNLQFLALSADALASGDIGFANMISSIQTDEARHAQLGGPTLEILLEHDPVRAQWMLDKMFWTTGRASALVNGVPMDYYTPLEHRQHSYKEFMEEWIIGQFGRVLDDFGLKRPWYWDEFVEALDVWQHSLGLALWYWRPTNWWKTPAGVSKAEREWLNEKYPKWEETYGEYWDRIIYNINNGNVEQTLPQTLPWICNTCMLSMSSLSTGLDGRLANRDYSLRHAGHTYHFCSKPCRQIWWEDRDNLHLPTVLERALSGDMPADLPGSLEWMGLTADVIGVDSQDYQWAREYLPDAGRPLQAAS